jgi:hypothetical protein
VGLTGSESSRVTCCVPLSRFASSFFFPGHSFTRLWRRRPFMNPYNPDSPRSWIKENLDLAWVTVHGAISRAGGPTSNVQTFKPETYWKHIRIQCLCHTWDGERELIKLLRSMAKQEVPFSNKSLQGTGWPGGIYSKMIHCFRPFDGRHTDHHIPSLEVFLKPEPEKK